MRIVVFLFCLIASYCAQEFSERPRNFSIELLQHIIPYQTDSHFVISPFSIWSLMSVVALGAEGESYSQLESAFLLPPNKASLVKGYRDLTAAVLDPTTDGVTLSSTNFVFLDNNIKVFQEFQQSLENDFKATVSILDFNDPNAASMANDEIQKTTGNSNDILNSDDFANSRMILANIISFKGLWTTSFNKSDTKEETFYDEARTPIGRVNMMYQKGIFAFSNIRPMKCFALELPYGNDKKYSMLFLLPLPNIKVTDAYKKLETVTVMDIFKQLQDDSEEFGDEEIDVKIPRFHIKTNIQMNEPLVDMGVYDIFQQGRARFDKITNEDIFVSSIVHKADIEVSEAGTVADAATIADFQDRISAPSFFANRPFIYFLVEKTTMTILFEGLYTKPSLE